MDKKTVSRRELLRGTAGAVAAFTIVPGHVLAGAAGQRPSDKLNLAAIGVGGMGDYNIKQCSTENFVALCDVDDKYAAKVFDRFPNARKYKDFRVMLDKEDKNIDGVVIATPDHTHSVIAMACLKHRKHIYLQKPLAHSIAEVRKLTEAAREAKVQTQMGNQGHSSDEIRMPSRMDRGRGHRPGAGGVRLERPARGRRSVVGFPDHGPAQRHAACPADAGLGLRGWARPAYRLVPSGLLPVDVARLGDFGTGALGDMGCHILDPVFWTLKLGHPTRVEATTTHYQRSSVRDVPAGRGHPLRVPRSGRACHQ